MGVREWKDAVRDLGDILGRARSPAEAAKAFVPPSLQRRRVLNDAAPVPADLVAGDVAREMRKLTRRLEGEALDASVDRASAGVNYAGLAGTETFAELERVSGALKVLVPGDLEAGDAEQAFWINLYNVLVIHGIVALGIRESVMEVPSFFSSVAYRIGDRTFTPDDVENGVLRRNGKHPATGLRLFKRGDPRAAFQVARVDPRVHMALVCAARSCPAISFYEAERLDADLEAASRTFVENDVEILEESHAVRLSVIFRYYADDFGGTDGVERFLIAHLDGQRRQDLERCFGAGYRLVYRRYDWSLNAIA